MQITVEQFIDAPQADVFAAATDVDRWAEYIDDIVRVERLTDGPVGVGTRVRETRRIMKKEQTEEMEFTSFVPNESYTLGANSCGCVFSTTCRLTPRDDGTVVTMDMHGQGTSFMTRAVGAVTGFMMKGMMRKCLERDLLCLKQRLEASPATAL
ncbi:MAG: SRPBCC family protein [Planctomycetota bacterium]